MTMILNIDGSRSCVLMAQDLLNALLTPLWEHQSLGTFYFLKTPPLDEFGNIDFGITRCFDAQGPTLGG